MDAATTNNIITGVGVVIALLALGTSVWTIIMQRAHNRLSAKPILDVVLGRGECILELTNCGLGPALLCDFGATIDGKSLDLMTDQGLEYLAKAVVQVIGRPAGVTPLRLTAASPILPAQTKPILTLRAPISSDELDAIRRRLREVGLSFNCRCIYGYMHLGEHAAVEDGSTVGLHRSFTSGANRHINHSVRQGEV